MCNAGDGDVVLQPELDQTFTEPLRCEKCSAGVNGDALLLRPSLELFPCLAVRVKAGNDGKVPEWCKIVTQYCNACLVS